MNKAIVCASLLPCSKWDCYLLLLSYPGPTLPYGSIEWNIIFFLMYGIMDQDSTLSSKGITVIYPSTLAFSPKQNLGWDPACRKWGCGGDICLWKGEETKYLMTKSMHFYINCTFTQTPDSPSCRSIIYLHHVKIGLYMAVICVTFNGKL